MSGFSRLCLLAVYLAGLMSVALGASVQWNIYSDLTCTNQQTSGKDSNAASGVVAGVTAYASTTCIPLSGLTGIRSASAGCTTGTVQGVDVTESLLVLYLDGGCQTKVATNGSTPSVAARPWGACATINPTTGYGSLSAKINCNSAASVAAASLSLIVIPALLAVFSM